jgi:hypothetical protein
MNTKVAAPLSCHDAMNWIIGMRSGHFDSESVFSQGREVILPSVWRTFPLAWRQDAIHVNCEAKVAWRSNSMFNAHQNINH